MANTIGTAYIQIEPTTKGIEGSISSALDGEASKAGVSAGGKLSSALGMAAKVGVTAIAGATAAVGAFGKSAVDAGQAFDSSMSQVAATMGFSTAELADNTSEASKSFKQLRDFAQEMGSSTAFSASEAAEALNYMALAGYDAETSMEMLPTVLDLAAAGGIDLASASDMVTDAQSALGLSLDETAFMVNEMAAASSKSNTSVSQLGEAFLTIGANAKSLSGGTTELATVLGVLADNGIKGAEGGTHLRNIMLALNPTTDAAVAAWERLGVSAYDAQGNLRPLEDTFGDLNKAMEGMTDQEKSDTLTKMFNKTDLASINALLATSSERWQQLGDDIRYSADAAQVMAETQLDNLSGDITLFQSALEGAKIAVSDGLTPALRDFVQIGSEGISDITAAFKSNGLNGAMEALGETINKLLEKIISMLPKMIEAGASLLKTLAQGIISNLPTLVNTGIQIILELVEGIIKALPEIISQGVEIVLNLVDSVLDNLDKMIELALDLIVALAEGIVDALPKLMDKAPVIIERLVEAIIKNLPKLLTAALKLILALADGLIQYLPRLLLQIPRIVLAIASGIGDGVKDMVKVGGDLISGLWEGIKKSWSKLLDHAKSLAKDLVNSFKDILRIGSPSKLFRDEVGQWIPAGIAVGIEGNTDVLDDSMKTMQSALDTSQLDVTSNYTSNYDTNTNSGIDSVLQLLNSYLPQLANQQIVLDSGTLVGATAPAMNTALGKISAREGYR